MTAAQKKRKRTAKNRSGSSAPAASDKKLARALEKIIEEHRDVSGALIPALHKAQQLYGYLPESVIRRVSNGLRVPLSEVWGVVTFYSFFSTTPLGRHQVRVCNGTACFVKGAQRLVDEIVRRTGVEVGGVTDDGKFSLQVSRCFGCCGIAPAVSFNGKIYQKVVPKTLGAILDGCK